MSDNPKVQERYFVVSNDELIRLLHAGLLAGMWVGQGKLVNTETLDNQKTIEAACRARPVVLAGCETDAECQFILWREDVPK